MRAMIFFMFPALLGVLMMLPAANMAQGTDESKYTPPVTSPFGKESRVSSYGSSDDRFRLLLGISGISILKGETALVGSVVGRDYAVKLKLGRPYKLNWFDMGRFWDEHINMVDEMIDMRASLATEYNLLTKKPNGLSTGIGLSFVTDSDLSGFSYLEVEYNTLSYWADINTKYLLYGSDPSFTLLRNDLTFSYGVVHLPGNGEKCRPYIEQVIGFGLGYLNATRLRPTNLNEKYTTDGSKFSCLFPLFYLELNVGLGMLRK